MAEESIPLDRTTIDGALAHLPGWRYRPDRLVAAYRFASAPAAVGFISAVCDIAEELGHHPDADWRYITVFLATSTHDAGGKVTAKDVGLARRVGEAAAASGGTAVPERLPPDAEEGRGPDA